ncbi:MAG: lamin tail domain-containing protein [Pseudomonadota bacterium]
MKSFLTTVLLSSFFLSCANPDLGDIPFRCNPGVPECPDGYICVQQGNQKVCLKEGATLDSGIPDIVTPPDIALFDTKQKPNPDVQGGNETSIDPDTMPPGKIYVSEFMANPDVVTDEKGEYIELYNPTSLQIDINGWTIRDNGAESHTIANGGPLFVPPNGFLVLGREADTTQNGGVKLDYVYSAYYLSNSEDEIIIIDDKGNVVDSFAYSEDKGFNIPKGASLSVKDPTKDKNVGSNWCTEPAPWPGSSGDSGSPGTSPGC